MTISTTNFKIDGLVNPIKGYYETLEIVTSSSNYVTLDYSQANVFSLTLSEAVSGITITNPPDSGDVGNVTLRVIQDPTTPREIDWGSIKWNGGTAPTVTASTNAVDFFTFTTFDGGTTWYGFVAAQDMS